MIYLSLGTNLGSRLNNLQKAVALLKKNLLPDLQTSIILETKAILPHNAPKDWDIPFLNMIAFGNTTLKPDAFLKEIKRIEKQIGRPENYERWSPRLIDIDILTWHDKIIDTTTLQIPHPELSKRNFLKHLMTLINPRFKAKPSNVTNIFTKTFVLSPKLVGIVNITPDSFSDGGLHFEPEQASTQAIKLWEDGASMIDLGAQSTRPGATKLTAQEELSRLTPVLDGLKDYPDMTISIDTYWPDVIRYVIKHYNIACINDVSNQLDDDTLSFIASQGKQFISMHALSIPPTKDNIIPENMDPIETLNSWSQKQIARLIQCGFSKERIILDPGIGFGKTPYQNIELLKRIHEFDTQGAACLVGHSRKSYIGCFGTEPACARDLETVLVSSNLPDTIDYLRVHDVKAHQRALVTQQLFNKDIK